MRRSENDPGGSSGPPPPRGRRRRGARWRRRLGITAATLPGHHAPGGGFRNPWPNSAAQPRLPLLRWVLRRALTRFAPPVHPELFPRLTPAFVNPHAPERSLTATWVGHSTVLLQAGGANILTDPIWSERASPLPFVGPKRWVAPGIDFAALPPIDLVLISHNHYDHLDRRTVRRLLAHSPNAWWVAPLGLREWLRARGALRVAELDWWEERRLAGVTVACTPARHSSARRLIDRDRTLWCGWTVAVGGRRMFFAGDSAIHPDFSAIGRRLGPFDLIMLPVGAYDPPPLMRGVHMDPDEALRSYFDLIEADLTLRGGRRSILLPVHWGTFQLTDEPMREPAVRVQAAWDRAGLSPLDLWLLAHGETRAL